MTTMLDLNLNQETGQAFYNYHTHYMTNPCECGGEFRRFWDTSDGHGGDAYYLCPNCRTMHSVLDNGLRWATMADVSDETLEYYGIN